MYTYILCPSSIDGESPQPEANLQVIPLYCWWFRSPWDFWTINSIDSQFGTRIAEVGKVPSIYFLKRQGSSVEGVFWGLEGWWWPGVGTHHMPPPENEHGKNCWKSTQLVNRIYIYTSSNGWVFNCDAIGILTPRSGVVGPYDPYKWSYNHYKWPYKWVSLGV